MDLKMLLPICHEKFRSFQEENGSSELDSLLKSLKGTVDLSASNTGTATVLSTERTQESTLEQFTSIRSL